ncbi:MAG: hypothetical protein LAP39_12215 [Acidobacteriia bacterium]|nr:hypothetical protein [Terriglobia bacterium]
MKATILALLSIGAAAAQQTVAPTAEPVGPIRGDNTAEYNVVNSIELGYRWDTVGGSQDEYNSQVNYGSGVRLLSSSLTVNSRDGHGRFFDEIVLTTQGLGNDPYESATLRVQKNRLYRFDMNWRLNDYVNPGLASAGQESGNLRDTEYTSQDDDLTLFPQSKFKFFLGYSRNVQDGPEFSSVGGIFAPTLGSFAAASVRDARNEYRIGNEFQVLGIKVNWMRGWEDFKEDSRVNPQFDTSQGGPDVFANPYHGTSPYWRVALFTDKKWFSMNGRFTYTGTQRAFLQEQSSFLGGAPPALGLQVVTVGTGHRPVATGNLTLSFFPTSKLSITNSTAVYNVRTEGEAAFLQANDVTGNLQVKNFLYLGIRTVANQTDLNYQAAKWLGLFGGYHYSDRFIRSILDPTLPTYDQTSILNAGLFGVRIRPVQPLTIVLDGEIGHANHPFTPKSDGNYQALNARVQYKLKSLMLSAHAQSSYNNNSIVLTAYSSHARTYAANASWTPLRWLSFQADYSKLHLDTLGGLSFFDSGNLTAGESLYISNLQTANLGLRFTIGKRVDLYSGYSHVQDTGDGRNQAVGSGFGPTIPEFQIAQTFPMRFQSPLARLSVKLTNRVRWNVGYQYYGYHEDFFTGQSFLTDQAYRAQTGYTSVLWSF